MTAHSTLTLHPWTCAAGHVTYDRDRPAHCAHVVGGRPCDASIAGKAPERRSPGTRRGGRGVDTPGTADANTAPQPTTTNRGAK